MKTFEEFTQSIVDEKMKELNTLMYDSGCVRERRINGYISFPESSRKCRFDYNSDRTNFYIKIVNKSDESFVAEIGNCMKDVTVEDLMLQIKSY